MRTMRPPTRSPCVCHTPYSVADGNIGLTPSKQINQLQRCKHLGGITHLLMWLFVYLGLLESGNRIPYSFPRSAYSTFRLLIRFSSDSVFRFGCCRSYGGAQCCILDVFVLLPVFSCRYSPWDYFGWPPILCYRRPIRRIH